MTPRRAAEQAEKESAAIIGFTSAIAAFGAFFIPKSYGTSIALDRRAGAGAVGLLRLLRDLRRDHLGLLHAPRRPAARHRARPAAAARRRRNRPNKETDDEPFPRSPDLLQARRRRRSPTATASRPTRTARWEDGYRKRWQHDKIVRSTHGVNCTGSCSWKIYVKGGIVTWETQQTDYPRTRPDLPNHEPRGCARGASYCWYLYSGNRVKYPLVRSRLLKLWREARALRDAGRRLEVDRRGSGKARRLHRASAASAASCARPGTRSTRSSPRPTPTR